MIILPNRKISHSKFLMPVLRREWLEPSQSQQKDCFGYANHTKFRVRAKLNDGFVVWQGWFNDRDDFDAFLWGIVTKTLKHDKFLWSLSTPNWNTDIGENVIYDFATVTFLTSPTGSNQTYNRPSDWNDNNNSIEVIGAGGSGGCSFQNGARYGTGGGGGAYSKITNLSLGATATYRIGSGALGVTRTTAGNTNGNLGGDSWFNGTTLAGSSVGAKGGSGGIGANSGTAAGGAGGVNTSGIGTTRYSGGTGGAQTSSGVIAAIATGGGGAAGPSGNGNNGVTRTTDGASDGGSGGAGFGGSAGSGGAAGTQGTAGGNGSDISTSPVHGSGGGGGGRRPSDILGAFFSNTGGAWGGAGGGIASHTSNSSGTSGTGANGIVVVTYENNSPFFNSPMLGM